MSELQTSAAEILKGFLNARFVEKDPRGAADLLTQDVSWLEPAGRDFISGRAAALKHLENEAAAADGSYRIKLCCESERTLAPGCGTVRMLADITGAGLTKHCRLTAASCPEDGREKLCSIHMSETVTAPETEGEQDSNIPIYLKKKYAKELYGELFNRSVAAGFMGRYCQEGFPLYTFNRQLAEMLGYGSGEELEADLKGLALNGVHPDDRENVVGSIEQQLLESNKYSVTYRMRKKDGGYIWVLDYGKRVAAEDGRTAIIGICSDITERQETLKHLYWQKKKLQSLIDTLPGGFFQYRADESRHIDYISPNMLKMLGYSQAEFEAKFRNRFDEMVWREDRERVLAEIQAQAGEELPEGSDYCEYRIEKRDGSLMWVYDAGHLVTDEDGQKRYYVVVVDISDQKQSELLLYERNAIFESLLENTSLSLWTYDIETRTATLVSSKRHKRPMSFQGTGDYPESVIKTGFIKSSSVETLRGLMGRVDAGQQRVDADIWYEPDDADAWCDHITYVNIRGENGDIIRTIGIAEDVTEQRIAQKRFNEELLYSASVQSDKLLVKTRCNLTRNLIESYVAEDFVDVGMQGMSYDAGIEALAATGWTEKEQGYIRRMLNTRHVMEEFGQGVHECSLDYRRKTVYGSVLWVNTTVKIYQDMESGDVKSFMYTTDINTEKLNESIIQAVASVEHDYIMLINVNTDEYEVYTGDLTDRLAPPRHGTEYTADMTEFHRKHISPDDVERSIHDMTPRVMRENLVRSKIFTAGYRINGENGEAVYKQNQYFWLDETVGLLILTRSDITDFTKQQQRQQELLRSALTQAEQANNAKTDFLSKMSHEIRTPMNAIIGMNALAAQNLSGNTEQAADCIAKVGISARFLLSLINDILDMSRIESGKVSLRSENIPFEEFLNGVNSIIYEQATDCGITYDSIITGYVADSYVGDTMKLQQILVNLLGNAVKFTHRGGKVQLIVSQERLEQDRAIMRFTVNDTGVGISEEFQKVMFTPFEQENSNITTPYNGTGLGLAITKNLVRLMGGSIEVHSIVGVGSEFVVTVPLGVGEEGSPRRINGSIPLDKMSALVVDDEILICQQTKQLLTEIGMKAEWVDSGRKAVELVRRRWDAKRYFDIILVDWKMPDMDGIETARQIRRIVGPDVTIIIITAYEWADIEREARAAGVNILVSKPIFKSSLISTFEKIYGDKHEAASVKPEHRTFDFTGRRALLVEDHLLNVEVARRLLAAKGMEVEVAENGLIAIEMFSSHPDDYYDLILMDIRMPVMDGLTATRSIRQLRKPVARTIPIIAMSANAFDSDVEKSRAAGMNAHLSKPFEPDVLYETISRFIKND